MFGLSTTQLILVAGSVWLSYAIFKLIQVRRFFKDVPKPPGHSLLFGHLKLFAEVAAIFPPNTHFQHYVTYISQKYSLPGVFYIDLWPFAEPQLIITDPDASRQIVAVNSFPKHPRVEAYLRPFVGPNGMPGTNGERWKINHRMVGAGLTSTFIKPMMNLITEQAVIFHDRLRVVAEKGEPISMEDETSKAIFDIIGNIVFGISLGAQQDGSQLLHDLRALIDPAGVMLWTWNPKEKYLAWRELKLVKQRIHDALTKAIKERFAVMGDEKELPKRREAKTIVDRIVADQLQNNPESPLDDEFMAMAVTNLKSLLLGGHGTTTDTFSFLIMLLSLYPAVLGKVREEHDAIFDTDFDKTVSILNQDPFRTNKLDYTNAVIKETLRMFPIGFTIRKAPEGVTSIELQGQQYPVGHNIMIVPCIHTTHMDPRLWKDPQYFRPERFLGQEGEDMHRFSWRAFERGPRACVAQDLAMEELRVMLLMTARYFDFETVVEKKTEQPKVMYMDLERYVGDYAFQLLGIGASPSKGMRTRIKLTGR